MRNEWTKKPEVLAPAGDQERLQSALMFGADAVYFAGNQFGMRTACGNFAADELAKAVTLCHAAGAKAYITCNVLARNEELKALPAFLQAVEAAGADALIVADIGLIPTIKQYAPSCDLHISTQFGVVNSATANMLAGMGASRVVLARELSLDEIADIRATTDPSLEIECFVHGAMCMAYSGRCMLSMYMTGRDSNRGDCAQPCRWGYGFTEKNRPGQVFEAVEENGETFLFNAYDLCMIEHIAALHKAGIDSFKIEGRAKAAYYTAVVTNAYRTAVDAYQDSGFDAAFRPADWIVDEVYKVSHRPYGTGFYFGQPQQNLSTGQYVRDYELSAVAEEYAGGTQWIRQRNRFVVGDTLEVLSPGEQPFAVTIGDMIDENGEPVATANHAMMRIGFKTDRPIKPGSMLRRQV